MQMFLFTERIKEELKDDKNKDFFDAAYKKPLGRGQFSSNIHH